MTYVLRLVLLATTILLGACASQDYVLSEISNYDSFVGKRFTEIIEPVAQLGFKKINETVESEELENRRPDGCSTIFTILKTDGVITSWRVNPSPSTCKVRKKPLNV